MSKTISFDMRDDTRVKVVPGPCACFVWRRSGDKRELSLSADGSLILWEKGEAVKDYGSFTSAETFMNAVVEFLHHPADDEV